jgi:hypothetical protein
MFIRFVVESIDPDSHRPQGVFVAAYSLLESPDLSQDEWKRLRGLLDWFNEHLPHPPSDFSTGRAIFWFRSSAKETIDKIWEVVHLLREHGHRVNVHKCRHLGNIRYRDAFQVAAYPSDKDGRVSIQ